MSRKSPGVKMNVRKLSAQEIAPAEALQKGFEVSGDALLMQKVNEIGKLLWFHEDATEDTKHQRIVQAIELYESQEPLTG